MKYTQEWGTFQYHNVMLMGIEEKPKVESKLPETDEVDKEVDYLVMEIVVNCFSSFEFARNRSKL